MQSCARRRLLFQNRRRAEKIRQFGAFFHAVWGGATGLSANPRPTRLDGASGGSNGILPIRIPAMGFTRCIVPAGALAIGIAACHSPAPNDRVQAKFDPVSGKLTELVVDAKKDGKPDVYSYMDGQKFVRIEIDQDEDGKIDRWEYYGDDQKLLKVGLSSSNSGKPDTWVYQGPDGSMAKRERSLKGDARVDRTEFYNKSVLERVEEDTDGDGQVDKWETYVDGRLATVGFDLKHSGRPTTTVDYLESEKLKLKSKK